MGALSQLVAYGVENSFLNGDLGTSATFWRQRYSRCTHFALESIDQTFTGVVGFGNKVSCVLGRYGDLVTDLVVEIKLRRGDGTPFYPAEHLLEEVELSIGGQRVDVLTRTWLRVYDELYRTMDRREAYASTTNFDDNDAVGTVKTMYVPLPFWFCRPSAALPMIALAHHAVQLDFTFGAGLPGVDAAYTPDVRVWADYVFLDHDERRYFAKTPLQYLIEQTQIVQRPVSLSSTSTAYNVDLPFVHALKYLAWVVRSGDPSTHGVFSAAGQGLESREVCGPLAEVGMQLNGADRFKTREGSYFRQIQPLQTFGQAPSVGVYVYSFGLHPARPVPSGTYNIGRLDATRLRVTTKAAVLADVTSPSDPWSTLTSAADTLDTLEVFGRGFNVLRIAAGMGGLVFANG